ncbi:hypothetical protein [Mangrovicoccus ximenensis]|uniref:hypothetical protein n=1 Tax=Mangrovicoccus ximenensis TaxID=1911570 RepID=UPI000D3AC487|nr:hypothetical protein [Mangrovicoccus ximenensis]
MAKKPPGRLQAAERYRAPPLRSPGKQRGIRLRRLRQPGKEGLPQPVASGLRLPAGGAHGGGEQRGHDPVFLRHLLPPDISVKSPPIWGVIRRRGKDSFDLQ